MQKLVAITGMDGVGKNSIIAALQAHFPESFTAEIWQPMYGKTSPFSSKQAVDDYLCSLHPESRTLFLAHALMESTQLALKSNAPIVFLNAYYFKYFASELALGVSEATINSLISLFPKPDLTIALTCPIATTSERKQRFSRYECGLVEEISKEAFVDFQNKCEANWAFFDKRIDTRIANVGEIVETVKEVVQQVKAI